MDVGEELIKKPRLVRGFYFRNFPAMKLEHIKIRNFRTIDEEITIDLKKGITIVGPNSSGKTNILKAVELLFIAYKNHDRYSYERDFPERLENGQTALSASFTIEDDDQEIHEDLKRLNECLESPKENTDRISLYLTFTRSGNPIYRFYSGEKYRYNKKNEFNSHQKSLIEKILNKFDCRYVPASKSIDSLYKELLLPFIKKAISKKIEEKITEIKSGLSEIAQAIDSRLSACGIHYVKSHFKIPNDSIEDLLSSFEYYLSDPALTKIENKGMGIQSASLISSFSWITEQALALGKKNNLANRRTRIIPPPRTRAAV
jgi:predicted ATP-dependent endonuclease of OLD family